MASHADGHSGPPYARPPRVAKHCGQVGPPWRDMLITGYRAANPVLGQGSATAPTFLAVVMTNTKKFKSILLEMSNSGRPAAVPRVYPCL
jgi:hypothetical protein